MQMLTECTLIPFFPWIPRRFKDQGQGLKTYVNTDASVAFLAGPSPLSCPWIPRRFKDQGQRLKTYVNTDASVAFLAREPGASQPGRQQPSRQHGRARPAELGPMASPPLLAGSAMAADGGRNGRVFAAADNPAPAQRRGQRPRTRSRICRQRPPGRGVEAQACGES